MDADRWRSVEELFHRAAEVDAEQRDAWLQRECDGDEELRAEVERMLRGDAARSPWLDRPGAAVREPAGDPWIGRELGAFRLTHRLGAGGMGVVYAAERADGLFDQRVAVKLIRAGAATAGVRRRFERERRTLAGLDHPYIARLLDGGTTPDGEPYLVMDLVQGVPIDRYCEANRLTVDERLRLICNVCRAVHHAHTNLVIHRDLKPANVLVDAEGAPKLLDFGIARLLDPTGEGNPDHEPTRTLDRALTPEYASPEQLSGGALTTGTDVYSIGVILYGLLTGRRPFRMDGGSPAAWERIVSGRPPTRPSTAVLSAEEGGRPPDRGALEPGAFAERCRSTPSRLRSRLRGDLDRIVLMALRKEPERRYPSAQALADDLERHLAGHPVVAREDSLAYRVSKFVGRHRLGVGAALLAGASLVYGLVAAKRGERLAAREVEHTRIEAGSFREMSEYLIGEFLGSLELESPDARERAAARVERQASIVRRKHASNPHWQANLLDMLGRVQMRLHLFDEAEELFTQAYDLRLANFGPDSLEVALSLSSVGELHYRRAEYGPAADALGRSLALHRTNSGQTHTDVATAANDYAVALRNLGELDRAASLHEEALSLRRASDPRTLPVAESCNNLAGVHLDRGEYPRAIELLQSALEIRSAILGPDHALSLQTLANLGNATWQTGRRAQGVEQLERAAAGFRALGNDGLAGLDGVLGALGAAHRVERQYERARARLDEALEIRRQRLGDEHPSVADLLTKIAELLHRTGDDEAARLQWERALAILETMDPPSPLEFGRSLCRYGNFLVSTGALDDARDAHERAVELLATEPLGAQAELGRAEVCLGLSLRAAGETELAVERLRSGTARLENAPDVPAAELETARGSLKEAEKALEASGRDSGPSR